MSPQDKFNSFIEFWKDHMVDPEQFPKIFQYQIKLWKYYSGIK